MCGIAGLLSAAGEPERAEVILRGMVDSLVHRGPDSMGLRVWDGAALGMRRLAIIDLVTGDQPMANESGEVWVVHNGEIYNHRELRADLERMGHRFRTRSDTEVLVHAWESWREGLVERLNGMFAFAVWDSRTHELFAARDRMGIKPLYWSFVDGILLFASELKAILGSGLVEPEIDEAALGQYLLFEYVPAPRSILSEVKKLEAGCWLRAKPGEEPRTGRYWDLRFEPDRSLREPEALEALRAAHRRAVELELMSDVPLGVLLSGGIDSSATTLAATQVAGDPVKTFTVAFADPSFDESTDARAVAAHLGTDHHEATLEPGDVADLFPRLAEIADEPLADSSLVPTYFLMRFAREHVKVALGGDGGDELWAGYPTHFAHRLARTYRRLPPWVRSGLIEPAVRRLPPSFDNITLDFRAKRFILGADLPPELQHHVWLGGYPPQSLREILDPELARCMDDEVLFEPVLRLLPAIEGMEPLDRILYLDAKLYLEGILTKTDRASMACSLEVRVPLLNNEVVEFARRVPSEWKLRGWQGKALVRKAIDPFVPRRTTRRGKKGFNLPIAKWLQGVHRDLLQGLVADPPPQVNRDAVARLASQHVDGLQDNRKLLWPLIVLKMWHDSWLTKSRAHLPA